ncbi:MAG: aminoacetone oxidase family FAD-binding enzyme [Planctomycetes bacterium]|nr:aminoacetone oxidase family FAD-binding enzyme [Planctomycetota bacterium]NOG52774.1 aminoacetone oxidase family FAD-binding enzyme [Planctomycetota bacterium]
MHTPTTQSSADLIIIIGAGAAGLMTAIQAARTTGRRITVLDGAARIGAKIIVSGGGRCNVTCDPDTAGTEQPHTYNGSSPAAIRKVIRRFDARQTVDYFQSIGVELTREDSGKMFPVTNRASTVLDALIHAAEKSGVQIEYPRRVQTVTRTDDGQFTCHTDDGRKYCAARLVLATGGKSLPKTGSDGHGYELARSLGHSLTPRLFPALVPLNVSTDCFVRTVPGIATPAAVSVRSSTGAKIIEFTGSLLCTHFGLSGPVILDVSRHYLDARAGDPGTQLLINWLPGETFDTFEETLLDRRIARLTPLQLLTQRDLPRNLARAITAQVPNLGRSAPLSSMTRTGRRAFIRATVEQAIPVTGDRGFTHAEVTAGGVPLSEVQLKTMESRICPGLYLVGEICDVDGRIGGYNFQWAWSSGFVAGTALATES